MRRRQFLYGLPGLTGLATVGPALPGIATPGAQAAPVAGEAHRAGPPTTTPEDIRFPAHSRPLRPGTAQEAGLLPEHVARIADEAAALPDIPGFALIAVRDGVIVAHEARGHALRYASWDEETATAVELPEDEWVPMSTDTLFDMASVTKLFTSTVAVQLSEQRVIDLDAPAADYLPEFAATDPAKAAVTVRQFLVHRSGLVSWLNLYADLPDNEARLAAIYDSPLQREPGSGYEYSDLNLITLGVLLERVTGDPLDALVADRVTGPLGLTDTRFNPPSSLVSRIAATEYQPWTGRGMIRGSVHDENAWAFGGVAGHAGIFSTASDMAVFAQMLANGGHYAGTRVLAEDTVRAVLTNHNADIGASPRGLGWQVDQRFFMDALCSPVTAGHTGYTGTSVTVDPVSRMVFVLLTNRVHPTRERGTESVYRRRPARAFARSLPVSSAPRRSAWFAGMTDATAARLTVPAATGTTVGFDLWYDTEPENDTVTVEAATDDAGTFRPVPLALRTRTGGHRWESDGTVHGYAARRWLRATADLPPGTTRLRWTYRTDADYLGRGVYVDRVRVLRDDALVFDSERPSDAALIVAEGWHDSEN
ncbi:serine hydrolase [Streptomyces sp. B6B3]|uniref:serine hydrolase n=1 Tax=Streptomyces sp. B6B3 TaxID=3153570 RepID=UPI00325DBAF1